MESRSQEDGGIQSGENDQNMTCTRGGGGVHEDEEKGERDVVETKRADGPRLRAPSAERQSLMREQLQFTTIDA